MAPGAPFDEIRQAYRRRARELHPDRHLHTPPEQAAAAARRMQDVNAAWEVLSNPDTRALYDLELDLARARERGHSPAATGPAPSRPTMRRTTPPPTYGEVARAGHGTRLFRGLPWMVVLAVLGFIFVFTAFAAGRGSEAGNGTELRRATTTTVPVRAEIGDCVRLVPPNAIDLVDCTAPHQAVIEARVPIGRPCPGVTRPLYLPDDGEFVCLRMR